VRLAGLPRPVRVGARGATVWLAAQGFEVTAMDGAPNAIAKARRLAAARGVTVDFHLADIALWDWEAAPFDAVIGIFIQFAPRAMQDGILDGMKCALRPGGRLLLLLHGFVPRQVGYGTGGPPDPDQMYTEALLRDRVADFKILELRDYDAEIAKGPGHSGRAALVDLVARRPG